MTTTLPEDGMAGLTHHRFPCVLPFSKMYPLCCIDIRNFMNQFLFFTRENFYHPNIVDETLRKVCARCTKKIDIPAASN